MPNDEHTGLMTIAFSWVEMKKLVQWDLRRASSIDAINMSKWTLLCSLSCNGCSNYNSMITRLIWHNRVIVSLTTRAAVVWRTSVENTEDECAAVAAELALPKTACNNVGVTGNPSANWCTHSPLTKRTTAVLETDEWWSGGTCLMFTSDIIHHHWQLSIIAHINKSCPSILWARVFPSCLLSTVFVWMYIVS